jgi:MinD-like ATPase involved in chromosome partitioning or flagellar assembly
MIEGQLTECPSVDKAEQHNNNKSPQARSPRIIAISSGKGGVGKSSISVNLGISLAKCGAKVCLFDADTGLANVNILMGLTPQYSLEHVLFGARSIEEVMLDGPHGMKIVPGANGISECVSLHPRQQLRLTRELARIEEQFDFILVDTAAGISDTTLDFISASQHALVVITPEPTSLTDAFSLIKLLKRRRSKVDYQVVVNMCANASQAKEVFHRFAAAVEKYIGTEPKYLGHILRDESLRAAVTLQNPVAMFPETDPSCRSFVRLADVLDRATVELADADKPRASFSAYWQKQYRQQSRKPERESSSTLQEEPELSAESRDADYLSELRSRLLLLIEQGHAPAEQMAELLRESVAAFVARNKSLPLDILELVEKVVTSPSRDDQLLRDIFDCVRSWGLLNEQPPTSEMMPAGPDEISVVDTLQPEEAPQPIEELVDQHTVDVESASSADDDRLCQAKSAETAVIEPVAVADQLTAVADTVLATQAESPTFDCQRFGSQQQLLAQIRQRDNSELCLADWLLRQ